MRNLLAEHEALTRRYFLRLGSLAAAGGVSAAIAQAASHSPKLQALIDQLEYLTPQADFGTVERGEPLPYTLPPDELRAAGLVRESWRNSIERVPLTVEG